MRNLEINVQRLSIIVPDGFPQWDAMRQTEFVQAKINTMELVIKSFNLVKRERPLENE